MADPRDFWHILPNYAKKDVVHYLDFKTRCNLSYCSKSDLALVKSTPIAFRYINFNTAELNQCRVTIRFQTLNCAKDLRVAAESTQARAHFLCNMLGAPHTCKMFFYGGSERNVWSHCEMIYLIQELKVRNIQPKIEVLKWTHTPGNILHDLLTKLDPEYLEVLMVNSVLNSKDEVERIVATEQWKKLNKAVIMNSWYFPYWLQNILDVPNFLIDMDGKMAMQTRRMVKIYQERNHPVGSCFVIRFTCFYPQVEGMYVDLGKRIVLSPTRELYLKKFPLADESLELRVQLMLTSASYRLAKRMDQINGIVVRKDAADEYVNVYEKINDCLYDH